MASLPVTSIVCPQCSHPSDNTQRFCGKCGQSLWTPCPLCKEEGPVGESFCGKCGTNLKAHQQQRVEEIEARLQKVELLETQHNYDEAVRQLRIVADVKEEQLKAYRQQASERIQQVTATRDRLMAGAATAYQAASKYLEQKSYEKAAALLEVTPEPMRDSEFQQLHRKCLGLCEEVKTLSNEIRDSVTNKDFSSVGEKIDRLLELKPNHPQASDVAAKLRARFCQIAKKRNAEGKYGEALDWLCRIPETQRDKDVEKQTRITTELLWLQTDLKTAALANHTLAVVADRLEKASPNNRHVQNQKQRILERIKAGPEDPRWAAPQWFSPQRTPFGCDAQWLGGFQSLDCSDTTLNQKYPGHFFTAIGLALQGAGCGVSSVNLRPQKQGLLKKLSFSSRTPKGPLVAWGLDLGTTAIKAVKLTFDSQSPDVKPRIENLEYLPHAQPLNLFAEAADKHKALQDTLQSFAEKHDTTGTKVCVSIPHRDLFCRSLDLPSVSDKRLAEMLPHEVQHQVPFPLQDIVWDHDILSKSSRDDSDKPQSMKVMIVAAKKAIIEQHVALLESAGINADILQSDCVALHSFAHHEFIRDLQDKNAAVALFDVGTNSSNVVISSQESAWFRSMSMGGNQITKAIVSEFQLTHEQAEQLKRKPEKSKSLSRLYEAIDPVNERLVSEFQRNVDLHAKDHSKIHITQILCLGGGSALHGLLRRVRVGRGHTAA